MAVKKKAKKAPVAKAKKSAVPAAKRVDKKRSARGR